MKDSNREIDLQRRAILTGSVLVAASLLVPLSSFSELTQAAGKPSATQHQSDHQEMHAMNFITTKDGTRIFYKDWGPKDATPIVFHHGWPLSADDWDNQLMFFLGEGFRVIAHDRRGHGRSDQTDTGNDMDTYVEDVRELVRELD